MTWDDELEYLVTYVLQHHGEEVLQAASDRALNKALHTKRPIVNLDGLNEADGTGVAYRSDGSAMSTDRLYEALRSELRKLMRQHE
jgi:hypothetical protein